MSWQASAWAIQQQDVTDPNTRFVLVCLANYAGPDGCNAFPSLSTLAIDTGLSESTIRRKLQDLEELQIIVKGNQAVAAAHIERGDRRPIVYDIPAVRGVTVLPREGNGVSPCNERGVKQGVTGCQALTPDPPSDPPLKYKTRARENPDGSRAEEEGKKRKIRDYWNSLKGGSRSATTIAALTGASIEEVQREEPGSQTPPLLRAPPATVPSGSTAPATPQTHTGEW